MRCHYMSDVHLEAQDFQHHLPGGDVLIIAGDLCHASALDPARKDPYSIKQRDRVLRFVDEATRTFAHVIVLAGNHEHYGSVFEDTAPLLRQHLSGVTVLEDEHIEIEDVRFFGTTLWTDLAGRDEAASSTTRQIQIWASRHLGSGAVARHGFRSRRRGPVRDAPSERSRPARRAARLGLDREALGAARARMRRQRNPPGRDHGFW